MIRSQVMGVGFSCALSYELKRSRLRLFLLGWMRSFFLSSNAQNRAPKPGEIFSILEDATKKNPEIQNNGDAVNAVTTIISPDISLSSLWVSTICLPPKHELTIQRATGMELFYVLQGTGEWGSQAHVGEEKEPDSNNSTTIKPIRHGDALILEPNSTRWFANTSSTENLILLRSSDAGHLHRKQGYDHVVPSSSRTTAAATSQMSAALTSGIQQMGGYLTSLVRSNSKPAAS